MALLSPGRRAALRLLRSVILGRDAIGDRLRDGSFGRMSVRVRLIEESRLGLARSLAHVRLSTAPDRAAFRLTGMTLRSVST